MPTWRARRGGNPDKNNQDVADLALRMGCSVQITTGVGYDFSDQVWGFEGLTILVEVTNPDAKPSKKTRERKERQRLFRERWRGGLCVEVKTGADVVAILTKLRSDRAGRRDGAPAGLPGQA